MKFSVKLIILFIIVGAGAAVAVNMGLFESDEAPEEIKQQIEALETRYYEVDSIKASDELYRIKLELNEVPSERQAQSWTESVCREVNGVLRAEGLNPHISVTAYVKLLGGKVEYYGEAFFNSNTYQYLFREP